MTSYNDSISNMINKSTERDTEQNTGPVSETYGENSINFSQEINLSKDQVPLSMESLGFTRQSESYSNSVSEKVNLTIQDLITAAYYLEELNKQLSSDGYEVTYQDGDFQITRHLVAGGDEIIRGSALIEKFLIVKGFLKTQGLSTDGEIEAVGKIKSSTGIETTGSVTSSSADILNDVHVGNDLHVDGFIYGKGIGGSGSSPDLGVYGSLEELQAAHPNPKNGDYAHIVEANGLAKYRFNGANWVFVGYNNTEIEIITKNDHTTIPSDTNVFSALKLLAMILRKDREDETNFLLKFLGGIEVGDFLDSMITGKGTGIFPDGRIQTDRLEVRGSMTVMDLIINEIHAMAGDWSLSDCGTIDKVEFVSDSTYKLWIRKETETDWTSLDEEDVLYSIVNNLKIGGTDYYTSWMRVVTKNVNDNTLTVVLWPDSEVPGGRNYPPAAGYNVTRRGNSRIPGEGEPANERTQSWLLSSREGRIMFLQNVYKPILEDYNFALTIGKIPKLKALEHIPVSEGELGIVAQTIIAQNFYQFDYNGNVVSKRVPRGAWSLEVAQGAYPYRYITKEYESENGTEYTQLEQHTVEHYGCTWGCIVDQTQDEPMWNSPGWVMIQGDQNYHLEFESSNGWQFFLNQVNTDVSAIVSYGNRDITNVLMASTGVEVEWLRDTGNVPADNSWKPTYVNDQKNVIHLSVSDMGSGWGQEYRKVSFICKVFIPVGEDFEKVENRINIKI